MMKQNKPGRSSARKQLNAKEGFAGLLSTKTANECIEESIKTPDPKMFFHNLIAQYENTVLFAAAGVGKSILAVQIAEDIAKTEKVIYVDCELSEKQFQQRYYEPETGKRHIFPANLLRADIDTAHLGGTNLCQGILSAIEQKAKEGVKFFVVDNISFICGDTERGKKAGDFMLELIRLKKEYGLTNIVIAHTPRRRGWRPITQNDLAGSAKLINFFDAAIGLASSALDENLRYLKQCKVRSCEKLYDSDNVLVLEKTQESGYLKFDIIGCDNEERHLVPSEEESSEVEEIMSILRLQKEGRTVRQIADELNMPKSTVQRRIERARMSHITLPEESHNIDIPVPVVPVPVQMGQAS